MQVGIQVLSEFPPENRREFIRSFKILPQFDGCRNNCSFCRLFEDVRELQEEIVQTLVTLKPRRSD